MRFRNGGDAILAAQLINHIKVKCGNRVESPLVKNILRVEVVWYVKKLMAKRAEDDKPWAIIIIAAPLHPAYEQVKIPAVRRPICPTEE